MNRAIIALGSNIEPKKNIQKAKQFLGQKFKILSESGFVTTKAVGFKNQADFLNGALLIETDLEPEDLKSQLQDIEVALGRIRTGEKFAPRTIDLDIVVWNNQIMDVDFYTRDYLKQSVLEVLPQLTY